MRRQTIGNKLGEIFYRQKLAEQQLGGTNFFPTEPTKKEFTKILKNKLKLTEKTFKKLKKAGVVLSPYLEIGSEHSLRPALLESQLGAKGIATDIALDSLANAKKYAKLFNFKKVPKAICCDAENLPFKSNSFPFVFIYETLHHFRHPSNVLRQVYRVLAPGGVCLIGAEPVKQSLQIQLWRRPTKLRVWEKILKYTLILPFISHIGKTEVEHGILEEAFPLKVWERSLSIFEKVTAKFKAFPFGPEQIIEKNSEKNWLKLALPTKLALWLFGGGLEAICSKPNSKSKIVSKNLQDLLICPTCLAKRRREVGLVKNGTAKLGCNSCKTSYQKKDGVLVLLENSLRKQIFEKLS